MASGGEHELRAVGASSFTWLDGERLIRFGGGVLAEAPELLAGRGFERYALVSTERANPPPQRYERARTRCCECRAEACRNGVRQGISRTA